MGSEMCIRDRYRHAYDIFMEYWESMPEDKRTEANKRLEGLGL